jgi:hypothetical protein
MWSREPADPQADVPSLARSAASIGVVVYDPAAMGVVASIWHDCSITSVSMPGASARTWFAEDSQ